MSTRPALTRDRVVAAAVRVADRGGLTAVSMRSVGRELGVEAMSLYHHVPGKEGLLDALADAAISEIELPAPGLAWREAMTARAASARTVLARHPWALGLLESRREPGPALLRHHDAVLGCLRRGGFPLDLAVHAFSAIDAYVYGFVLTEINLPFDGDSDTAAGDFVAGLEPLGEQYPYLAEVLAEQFRDGRYSYAPEFGFGLELVLDGLTERLARRAG